MTEPGQELAATPQVFTETLRPSFLTLFISPLQSYPLNQSRMKLSSALLTFAVAVSAHGDHGYDQEPLAGPHGGLWYNTLPGDGGTQVLGPCLLLIIVLATDFSVGRFDLQWHIHVRPSAVSPLPQQQRRLRYSFHW